MSVFLSWLVMSGDHARPQYIFHVYTLLLLHIIYSSASLPGGSKRTKDLLQIGMFKLSLDILCPVSMESHILNNDILIKVVT